jgi:hypothetical protein
MLSHKHTKKTATRLPTLSRNAPATYPSSTQRQRPSQSGVDDALALAGASLAPAATALRSVRRAAADRVAAPATGRPAAEHERQLDAVGPECREQQRGAVALFLG